MLEGCGPRALMWIYRLGLYPRVQLPLQVQSAVLHTSSSLCNIDFGAPPPNEVPKRKLRRMAGGNPEALGRAGQNFRVFTLENPCLLCEYTSSKAVLLVRCSSLDCLSRLSSCCGCPDIPCTHMLLQANDGTQLGPHSRSAMTCSGADLRSPCEAVSCPCALVISTLQLLAMVLLLRWCGRCTGGAAMG